MRVAAIDVGTNSTRMLVAEEVAGGFRALERRLTITRLGQGVDRDRRIDPEALKRTIATIAEYVATCGEYGVATIRVTGTSAVRDARNRSEFFEAVKALTGKEPEMLSGEQEARTTFLGAVSDLTESGPRLVVDIGGGSTELILGDAEPEALVSLDIGCVRMLEKHLVSDPPASHELDALRAEVASELEKAAIHLNVPAGTRLVGVAGTVTQLATLQSGAAVYDPEITHHAVMSHGDVRMLARRLASLPYEKRARIQGLDPGRVDVIVAGAAILQQVMETFDMAEVLVSEKDILDGLVLDLLSEVLD